MEWIKKNWMWVLLVVVVLFVLFRDRIKAALGQTKFGDREINSAASTNNNIQEDSSLRAGFIAPPEISVEILDRDSGDFSYEMRYDRYRIQGVLNRDQPGPMITYPTNNGTFTARTIVNQQAGGTQFVIIYPLYDNEVLSGYRADTVKKAYFYIFSPGESYQNWKALNSKAAAVYDFFTGVYQRTK